MNASKRADSWSDTQEGRKKRKPSYSESAESPENNSEVKLAKSCDLCKSRKVKCDGAKPRCRYCNKHDLVCVYNPMKKPGLRVGYGKEVSDRLGLLEDKSVESESDIRGLHSDIDLLKRKMESLERKLLSGVYLPKPASSPLASLLNPEDESIAASSEMASQNSPDQKSTSGVVPEGPHDIRTSAYSAPIRGLDSLDYPNPVSDTSTINQDVSLHYSNNQKLHDDTLLGSSVKSHPSSVYTPGVYSFSSNHSNSPRLQKMNASENARATETAGQESLFSEEKALGSDPSRMEGSIPDPNGVHENNPSRTRHLITQPSDPTQLQTKYVLETYFKKVHPLFPILHPYHTFDSIYYNPHPHKTPFVFYAILFASLRFIKLDKLSGMFSPAECEHYYHFCCQKIMLNCISVANLDQLTAMTLFAFSSYGSFNGTETRSFIALACSGAVHLNLIREKNAQPLRLIDNGSNSFSYQSSRRSTISSKSAKLLSTPANWFEEESRRRVFWGIYILDKLSSVANSFPSKIPESEVNLLLPAKLSYWEESENKRNGDYDEGEKPMSPLTEYQMIGQTRWLKTSFDGEPPATPQDHSNETYDSFSYSVEVCHILGDIHSFLRKPLDILSLTPVLQWQMNFHGICGQIAKWKATIPLRYQKFLDQSDNEEDMTYFSLVDINFHALYHMMIIRLHSSVGYPHIQSKFFTSTPTGREKCIESAARIVAVARTLTSNKLFTSDMQTDGIYSLMGPQYAFCLWVASRLLVVDALTEGGDFSPDLHFLVDVLFKSGKAWYCATKYAQLVTFLMNEQLELSKKKVVMVEKTHGERTSAVDDESASDSDEIDDRYHSSTAKIFFDMRCNSYVIDFVLTKKMEQKMRHAGTRPKFEDRVKDYFQPSNPKDMFTMDEQFHDELAHAGTIDSLFSWFKLPVNVAKVGDRGPPPHSSSVDATSEFTTAASALLHFGNSIQYSPVPRAEKDSKTDGMDFRTLPKLSATSESRQVDDEMYNNWNRNLDWLLPEGNTTDDGVGGAGPSMI